MKSNQIPEMITKPREKSMMTMNFDAELKKSCQQTAKIIGITLTEFMEQAALRQLSKYAPEFAKKLFEEIGK